jgi:hypothetical protein
VVPVSDRAPLELVKKYTINLLDRDREISIHKKSGLMKRLQIRPALIKKNMIAQLKSKGS